MADFVVDDYARFNMFYMLHDGTLFQKFLCFVTMTPFWVLFYLVIAMSIYRTNQQRNTLLLIAFTVSFVVNKILKRLINQARPYNDIYDGYGMPSDHAQFAFLWAGYFHQLLSHHQRFNWGKFVQSQHKLYIVMIWIWCILICYSRYALLFHSILQLIMGGIIGIILAILFYKIDEQFISDTSSGGAYFPFALHMD